MKRLFLSSVAAAIALGFALPASAQVQAPAKMKEIERDKVGDWTIRCIEGTEDCRMTQIGKTAQGQEGLMVSIQRLDGAKTQNGTTIPAAMQVQAPLGILLPYGVRLQIDQGDVAPISVTRCLPIGCIAGAPMTDEAVNLMKKGATANFSYVLKNETPIGISLSGFTKAYESLTPLKRQTQ